MTTSRPQWVLVAALCLLIAACGRRLPEDRPPGVGADSWVRISDVAGIVLTRVATPISVPGSAAERMAFPTPRDVTGVLMVKLQGVWTRVDLELPDARVHPLQ